MLEAGAFHLQNMEDRPLLLLIYRRSLLRLQRVSAYFLILQLLSTTAKCFLFFSKSEQTGFFFKCLIIRESTTSLRKTNWSTKGENAWEGLPGSNYVLSICVLFYRSEGESSRSVRYVYVVFFLTWWFCSKKILCLKSITFFKSVT